MGTHGAVTHFVSDPQFKNTDYTSFQMKQNVTQTVKSITLVATTSIIHKLQGSQTCREKETDKQKEKMCYQTHQKGNHFLYPYPYVTKVMFHDIHPDSDTCQAEVLTPFPCTSIWTMTTSGSCKTGQEEKVIKAAKYKKKELSVWARYFFTPFRAQELCVAGLKHVKCSFWNKV